MRSDTRAKYAQSSDSPILVGAAQSIWNGSDARMTLEIQATYKLREAMSGFGIDPLERVFLTDSDIRHIMKHHASNEVSRGQIDIVPDDFGRIPDVLGDFDSFKHVDTDKLGNRKFELSKAIGDTYYVVTIQRGKRKLQIKTMWKKPGASCQPSSGSLGPTSETTPASGKL